MHFLIPFGPRGNTGYARLKSIILLVLIIQTFEVTTCRPVKPYHVCSISYTVKHLFFLPPGSIQNFLLRRHRHAH